MASIPRDSVPGATLSDIVLHLGETPVFDGLSLDLRERRVGVIGFNGSGKSTLARLVCGLIAPDSGTVLVDGVEVCRDRKQALRAVGMVFQNPDHQIIFPTVEEEVAFGLQGQGQSPGAARRLARRVLGDFGRNDWAERPVHSLSQGQRHLVCLISAIAMRPALLVLDEPFAGPDLPTLRQLHRQLNRLDSRILLITHDLQAIAGYDRAIWLDRGKIRADGVPDAVAKAYRRAAEKMDHSDAFADLPD